MRRAAIKKNAEKQTAGCRSVAQYTADMAVRRSGGRLPPIAKEQT